MRVSNEQIKSALKADHITGNTTNIIKEYGKDLLEAREIIKDFMSIIEIMIPLVNRFSLNGEVATIDAKYQLEKTKEYAE